MLGAAVWSLVNLVMLAQRRPAHDGVAVLGDGLRHAHLSQLSQWRPDALTISFYFLHCPSLPPFYWGHVTASP
ncbi:MAG: hypothetical protein R2856_13865 [Caldilineaceae bacterium]